MRRRYVARKDLAESDAHRRSSERTPPAQSHLERRAVIAHLGGNPVASRRLLDDALRAAAETLAVRAVWMVNSTSVGGGVAELLRSWQNEEPARCSS
jgi:hypothetical protein